MGVLVGVVFGLISVLIHALGLIVHKRTVDKSTRGDTYDHGDYPASFSRKGSDTVCCCCSPSSALIWCSCESVAYYLVAGTGTILKLVALAFAPAVYIAPLDALQIAAIPAATLVMNKCFPVASPLHTHPKAHRTVTVLHAPGNTQRPDTHTHKYKRTHTPTHPSRPSYPRKSALATTPDQKTLTLMQVPNMHPLHLNTATEWVGRAGGLYGGKALAKTGVPLAPRTYLLRVNPNRPNMVTATRRSTEVQRVTVTHELVTASEPARDF